LPIPEEVVISNLRYDNPVGSLWTEWAHLWCSSTISVRPLSPDTGRFGASHGGLPAALVRSEIHLLGKNKRVVYLDAEITNRAFRFGMTE
jgi:hypothetical protein